MVLIKLLNSVTSKIFILDENTFGKGGIQPVRQVPRFFLIHQVVIIYLPQRSWPTRVQKRSQSMPRPDPTQENSWFENSFLKASPQ